MSRRKVDAVVTTMVLQMIDTLSGRARKELWAACRTKWRGEIDAGGKTVAKAMSRDIGKDGKTGRR
jgi:hypothetical protein